MRTIAFVMTLLSRDVDCYRKCFICKAKSLYLKYGVVKIFLSPIGWWKPFQGLVPLEVSVKV